jgi:acid phosphatase
MRPTFRMIRTAQACALFILLPLSAVWGTEASDPLQKIEHLVVIYQENWSFDGLFGKFPGAAGIGQADGAVRQVDKTGRPLGTLPRPIDNQVKPAVPDLRFPADMPVAPYDLSRYVAPEQKTGDLVHRFYQNQYQIDGGKNDKFVAWSDNGGLTMSYYDGTALPTGKLARQYTLADNFFQAAFGGSFLNHFWLVCACTPVWPDAPADKVVTLDAAGVLLKDNAVTPDGYVVNTSYSVFQPHPADVTDPKKLVPPQTQPTIGDRLSSRGISWAWYSGGWDDALAGKPAATFQFHHQPFAFFAAFADDTAARKEHLKDEKAFFADLKAGKLPSVSFIKPVGDDDEHPGYASLLKGQQHVADLVKALQESPYWQHTAIVITYDEYGGRWDHVAPPTADRWGPGTRIPAIIVSPYARRGYVDHTPYDTTSILKFIERRWKLAPLGSRDAAANDLSNAFDFQENR